MRTTAKVVYAVVLIFVLLFNRIDPLPSRQGVDTVGRSRCGWVSISGRKLEIYSYLYKLSFFVGDIYAVVWFDALFLLHVPFQSYFVKYYIIDKLSPRLMTGSNSIFDENMDKYCQWLLSKGESSSAIRGYSSAIRFCNQICIRGSVVNQSIFDISNNQDLELIIDYLTHSDEIIKLDCCQNGKYVRVLLKYATYVRENILKNNNESIVDLNGSDNAMNQVNDKRIFSVWSEYFSNGINPDSAIEMGRFQIKYSQKYVSYPADGVPICDVIRSNGIKFGDKYVYCSEKVKEDIIATISEISSKHRIVYYEQLYDYNIDYFRSCGIGSEKLLIVLLKTYLPDISYKKRHFEVIHDDSSDDPMLFELNCCFDNYPILQVDQIEAIVKYIPSSEIYKYLHSHNYLFKYVRIKNAYVRSKDVLFDEDEVENAIKFVHNKIADTGFISINNISLDVSLSLNHDITDSVITECFYDKYLSEEYCRNNSLIVAKGEMINFNDLLSSFIGSKNTVTVGELESFEKEVVGTLHKRAFNYALSTMIRVDKDNFVDRDFIIFDVDSIDDELDNYVPENIGIMSVGEINNFYLFPAVPNYPWNNYLLGSFCRLCSKKYFFTSYMANYRKSVGAIVSRSCYPENIDFFDICVNVVLKNEISIDRESIGEFLSNKGYIARRDDMVSKIVSIAKSRGV